MIIETHQCKACKYEFDDELSTNNWVYCPVCGAVIKKGPRTIKQITNFIAGFIGLCFLSFIAVFIAYLLMVWNSNTLMIFWSLEVSIGTALLSGLWCRLFIREYSPRIGLLFAGIMLIAFFILWGSLEIVNRQDGHTIRRIYDLGKWNIAYVAIFIPAILISYKFGSTNLLKKLTESDTAPW